MLGEHNFGVNRLDEILKVIRPCKVAIINSGPPLGAWPIFPLFLNNYTLGDLSRNLESSGAGPSPLMLTKACHRASGWHVERDRVSGHDEMSRRTRSCISASLRADKLKGANTTPTQHQHNRHAIPRAEPYWCVNLGNASVRPEESAPLVSRAPISRTFVSGADSPVAAPQVDSCGLISIKYASALPCSSEVS
jgi:hypothetical protein